MTKPPRKNALRISHEILAYLSDHPYAQDTIEGITGWWLLEQEIKHQVSEVKTALAKLVASGLVLEKRRQSAPASYCINPDRVPEVQEMVGLDYGDHIVKVANTDA